MKPFLVLVSRHFWTDRHTFQVTVCVDAGTPRFARQLVRAVYSSEYTPWVALDKDKGKLVAYFTGHIHGLS